MSGPANTGPALAAGRFAIRAGRLFDGYGGPARERVLVIIEDGVITAVDDATVVGDPGCPVEDASDRTLLPGYVDAHTHLAWLELDDDAADPAFGGLVERRAGETLVGGVTLTRDLGGPADVLLDLRSAIAAGECAGPRLLVSGPPVTLPTGHCHWFGCHATSADEGRAAVETLADLGVDLVKLMVTGGMATPTTDPYAPQYPIETARHIVETAHRLDLPVAAHALGTPGVRVALAAGVDTLEHGWTITGREQRYEPDVIEELRGAPIVGSVSAHHDLRGLMPFDGRHGDLAELRRRLVPHRALAAAGVPVVTHSDAGAGSTPYDTFGESVAVYAAGMGVSVAEAVHAATLAPARALDVDSWCGSVAPGRVADLVLLEGDPDEDEIALRAIDMVYLGGRLTVRDGTLVMPAADAPAG